MPMRKFALTLPETRKTVVFPLPQTNHYQKIEKVQFPPGGIEKFIDSENKVVLVHPSLGDDLTFYHKPIAIKKDIANTSISRTSNYNFTNDDFVNANDTKMRDLAKTWLKHIDKKNTNAVVQTLYEKTLDFLSYGNPIPGLYTYREALDTKVTDCGGFSTFLMTLLQTENIPARLVVGYLYKLGGSYQFKETIGFTKHFADISMHAWLEVLEENGNWFPLDPSVDWKRRHNQTSREGGFGIISADRLVVSFRRNHIISLHGKKYQFPILQHPEII